MNENRTPGVTGPGVHRHRIRAAGAALMIAAVAVGIMLTGCGEDIPEPPPPSFSGNDSLPADTSEVPRITAEQVRQRLDAGVNLVIVDVRSAEDFEDLHIAGAISIPEEEIIARQSELQAYDEIVLYCR